MKTAKKTLTVLLFCLAPILCYSQAKPYQIVSIESDTAALIPIDDYRALVYATYKERECRVAATKKELRLSQKDESINSLIGEVEEWKKSDAAKEYALLQQDTIRTNDKTIIKGLKKKNTKLKIGLGVAIAVTLAKVVGVF